LIIWQWLTFLGHPVDVLLCMCRARSASEGDDVLELFSGFTCSCFVGPAPFHISTLQTGVCCLFAASLRSVSVGRLHCRFGVVVNGVT